MSSDKNAKAIEKKAKADAIANAKAIEKKAKADAIANAKALDKQAKADAIAADKQAKADAIAADKQAKADAKAMEEAAKKYHGQPLECITDDIKQQLLCIASFAKEVAMGLGKGRVEGVYQNALCQELQMAGINYQAEETISIKYKNRIVGQERLDIHIYGTCCPMILELKATSSDIKPDEHWQVISYMHNIGCKYGAVINFNQGPTKGLQIDYIVISDSKPYLYDIDMGLTVGEPMNNY